MHCFALLHSALVGHSALGIWHSVFLFFVSFTLCFCFGFIFLFFFLFLDAPGCCCSLLLLLLHSLFPLFVSKSGFLPFFFNCGE